MAELRVTYDRGANAAYIYLVDKIGTGASVKQVLCDDKHLRGDIVLDIDKNGKLLGIEILEATRLLSPEFLARAERIG